MVKIKEFFNTHESIKRATKTFIQAFCGVLITTLASGEYELTEWKTWGVTVISSAISAGFSAVMNIKKRG